MRFDIDDIDLLSVFLGWLWIFFCSFMILIVGLLTGITWITSIWVNDCVLDWDSVDL
jgi:hypothetical protein